MFENSMKVVKEDNELLKNSDELIKFTRDTITDHKYYYLDHIDKYSFAMLQNMVVNILSETDIKISDEEIDQITKSYLYALISSYCKTFSPLVWSHVFGSTNGYYRIDGLNENQKKWLIDNFGIYIPRGKYFLKPPIVDLEHTLLTWGVKPVNETRSPPIIYWH